MPFSSFTASGHYYSNGNAFLQACPKGRTEFVAEEHEKFSPNLLVFLIPHQALCSLCATVLSCSTSAVALWSAPGAKNP